MKPRLTTAYPLVLASQSAGRRQQMHDAGLHFRVESPLADETRLKQQHSDLPLRDLAMALAVGKGLSLGEKYPDELIVAGDQICETGGTVLSKPGTTDRATAQLRQLSGKVHYLHTAGALIHGTDILWQGVATTAMHMRRLNDAEIETYVVYEDVRNCCGSYRFESLGKHLFARVDGDASAIPGLPIVPLLAAMHRLNLVAWAHDRGERLR